MNGDFTNFEDIEIGDPFYFYDGLYVKTSQDRAAATGGKKFTLHPKDKVVKVDRDELRQRELDNGESN